MRLKPSLADLIEWRRSDPEALLQAALGLWRELAEETLALELMRGKNAVLGKANKEKDQRIAELETALEQAQCAPHRQAAPFRVREERRVGAPKRPGRKPGHEGAYRPRPDYVDESLEVPLCSCPQCGGTEFIDSQPLEQFIEEIPVSRPRVTRLTTWSATCVHCQREVRSAHPLQVSLATGAAGNHLGPRALALATDLNKAKGLSMRKTCAVLHDAFGLNLTPGGLSQAVARMALKLKPVYENHALELREADVVHSDETSWWVGGPGWWLWVFTNAQTTCYIVIKSRGRAVIEAMLGSDFPGTLVSDCLCIYDGATPTQHKCYSHHFKAIKEAKAIHPQKGEGFLNEMGATLKKAMALKTCKPQLSPEEFAILRTGIESEATALLKPARTERTEEKIRNRLNKQIDHLFTFLDHDDVDATNNLAERQLRPAVIARKISCGNKSATGARTWEILASIAATCAQRFESFIDFLARAAPV